MANLSQEKRQRMLAFLETIREEHKDDDEVLIALGEIESELNAKKYGLVWERHEEAVDVQMRDNIPVFTECVDKEITTTTGGVNFLLEGDNLHSLRLLEKTHTGKIDVIYIDPPYNTGNKDFTYDDKFVAIEDGYRHSKWLSFMYERLVIASSLLSGKGVIFIQIDDNEQAPLKLLCDDIFGENNFLGIIIQNKMNAKNDTTDIQKNHEYILAYRKKTNFISGTKVKPTLIRKTIKYRDAFQEGNRFYYINDAITTRGEGVTLNARPNLGYTVYYNPETGDKRAICDYDVSLARTSNDENLLYTHDTELIAAGYTPIIPPMVRGKLGCWTWALDKFNAESDSIIITGKKGKYAVKKRTFVNSSSILEIDGKLKYKSIEYTNSKSILEYSTNEGTNLLNALFGHNVEFNNPKNLDLVEYLLSLANDTSATILDFFAGSGTTGHAVLKLNAEDGGNRRFILCTNNENNICEEVTYERIKRVIEGYGDTEGIPANLKYYHTDFVSKDSDSLTDELLDHIREMIQLEHGIQLDGSQYIMVLTDEEADALEQHWDEYKDVKALYVSRNVLFTTEQNMLFGDVNIHIIPDDYFKFELQEVGESW